MATSVYFNGKLRTLPGAYSTITSGDSTASRSLDYGTVLIIDTGVYGAGFGGGAGVNGEGAQGLDAIYEFDDLTTFRNFVKGGMYWKCAEALWKPDPSNADAVGISKLLFVRACTTKAAKMTFTATGGGSNGGTFVIRTIDEGLNANGVTEEIDGVTYLKNGYAFTTEAGVDNPEAVVLKLWQGTFTGLYKDPVTGVELSYNELTVEQSDANLLCESPECTTMAELIYWAQTDENFGARFVLDDATAVKGTGEMNASDVTDGYQLAAGGTETYTPNTDLESVLSQIADVDYNIVMTDQIGANALSAANKAIIAHRNLDAKFDKFVFIGAYDSRANYEASLAYAKQANNAYVCIVHGGIGTASDMVASKIRWWGVFYNLCQVVGRTAGKPPYVPITNKTIGGDKLQMIPNEKEMEKAVKAGFMESNPYKDKGFVPGEYNGENYDKIDLHRPYVDDIILVSKDGKPMKREADLIDVWFDSGAMPYAQIHYPFENKELLDSHQVYPADFIAEGVDQTRGWFFTLHAIASMVFDTISYKTVISNGLVLDKNGNKMSKRLGNGVDPFSTIEKYGSDPLRWYMITNSSPWDNLKFDVDGIEEVRRKFFGTLYNTYSFFSLYANVDGFEYKEADVPMVERPEIDRWILSVLNTLVKEVDTCYSEYEPTKAGRLISDFVNDNLSNWYVRLNRKRFWGGEFTQDKLSAYQTLYTCLETVAKLMSPIAPFYADKLYMDLVTATGRDNVVSVHLAKFPEYKEEMIDKELEVRMQMAQDVTSMVLALRRKVNIKVRQPLQCIMIPVVDEEQRAHIEAVKALIMSEVNVKDIKFVDGAAGVLVKKVKCDFKKMGPKFGKQMKAVAAAVAEMSQEAIAELEKNGSYTLQLDGTDVLVEATDVEIFSEDIPGWLVANEGKLTVALDVTVTEELRREGIARELVNRIQNIRKSSGLEITDKIKITLSKNQQTDDAVNEYKDYICNQVLGTSLTLTDEVENGTELNFDDFSLYVSVVKE